jgi:hypothetical protein
MTKAKFVKQFGRAALEDREKRMSFGLEWCKDGEFKFIYSGYDKGVSYFSYCRCDLLMHGYSRRSD